MMGALPHTINPLKACRMNCAVGVGCGNREAGNAYYLFENMAERVGFEPTIPVKVCPLSRRIVSTAHAPLRRKAFQLSLSEVSENQGSSLRSAGQWIRG